MSSLLTTFQFPIFFTIVWTTCSVTALGFYLSKLLSLQASPHLPTLFLGTFLFYSVNRWIPDPADPLNNRPAVSPLTRRFLGINSLLCLLLLLLYILFRHDPIALITIPVVGVVTLGYFIPVPGLHIRLKDIPLLKSFLPPIFITGAALLYPAWRFSTISWSATLFLTIWLFLSLLQNVCLCDLRDQNGDHAHGVQTLALLLSSKTLTRLLILLPLLALTSLLFLFWFSDSHTSPTSILLFPAAILSLSQIFLAFFHPHITSRMVLDWVNDGLLTLPWIVLLVR